MYANNKIINQDATASRNATQKKPFFQAKLTINQPNDVYEQEADAMADKVMRMPDASINNNTFFKPAITPVQRKCAHCEEEEKQMQRKEDNSESVQLSSATENYINNLSGGKPLENNEKNFFESRMSYDFSNVRLHTDSIAAKSAQSVNALAYTSGNNIVFNNGQYAPGTNEGKKLMAHELTHVVQQNNVSSSYSNVQSKYIQRAPTIKIRDQNFIGPMARDERRATLSCPIKCNGITNVGTLHSMGLFYSNSRTGSRDTPAATDNGVGTALHFISSGPKRDCPCDDFKIIQIITTTHPAAGRSGSGYVDNNGVNTPFYSDVYAGGQGEHAIPTGFGFRDAGERVDTTNSLYDIPFRSTTGINTTITWQGEACVACIRNAAPDIILGGVSYGFTIPYNNATNSFGTIQGIGPSCLSVPSSNFVRVLSSDPTIAGYDFVPELGVGDFPTPRKDVQYA